MTSKAFDLALFVGVPANLNDASVIVGVGPPFTTGFKSVALSAVAGGVTVGADMPAAAEQNQILISGPAPDYAWGLGTNPAAAAAVPPATAQNQLLLSDAGLQWQDTNVNAVMVLGNAVTTTLGGTFTAVAKLVFTNPAVAAVRIDGGNPALSQLDNFFLDCGTF